MIIRKAGRAVALKKISLHSFAIGAIILLQTLCPLTHAKKVNWQGPAGITIKDVKYPAQELPQADTPFQSFSAPAAATVSPYPEPPLAGFSPLVVIATSDKKK